MDFAIKYIKELLEFFKKYRVSNSENCSTIAKQIPIVLEIEIIFKDHCIQWKRKLFSHGTLNEVIIIEKNFLN